MGKESRKPQTASRKPQAARSELQVANGKGTKRARYREGNNEAGMKVHKRSHMLVDYKEETIANAIRKAMTETIEGIDEPLAWALAREATAIMTRKVRKW